MDRKEYMQDYNRRMITPEKRKEYNRRYRERHKEKEAEYRRKYYIEHKEQMREWNRKWFAEHPEKVVEYREKYKRRKMNDKKTLSVDNERNQ